MSKRSTSKPTSWLRVAPAASAFQSTDPLLLVPRYRSRSASNTTTLVINRQPIQRLVAKPDDRLVCDALFV
jgi:hypothetical protein